MKERRALARAVGDFRWGLWPKKHNPGQKRTIIES
jgi:hypothetical protein